MTMPTNAGKTNSKCWDGDAQVGPEGQQHGQDRGEAAQRDDGPEHGALVRCLW